MSLLSLCMIFWTNKLNQTKLNLHQPSVNVTKYQTDVHCIGVKVFNMLQFYIKAESDNPKKFKVLLQKYLCENSFYSLDEYFQLQSYVLTYDLN